MYIIPNDLSPYQVKTNWNFLESNFQGCFFVFLRFYLFLFLERGEGKEKERDRTINVWLLLACPPLGAGPQPRHVP